MARQWVAVTDRPGVILTDQVRLFDGQRSSAPVSVCGVRHAMKNMIWQAGTACPADLTGIEGHRATAPRLGGGYPPYGGPGAQPIGG
eukprot:COSAG01_NODE_39121_length_480_cov_17.905512_1_plen_87_part_00